MGLFTPNLMDAWPTGSHEQLLLAALQSDDQIAFNHLLEWTSKHDLDDVEFREQRIILAACARFSNQIRTLQDAPRIEGLRRMLWTRTVLLLRDCGPIFGAFAEAGLTPLLIKGAARLAKADQRGARSCHDLDIVVPKPDFAKAAHILFDHDWRASTGYSRQRVLSEAQSMRSLNFYRGRFGDIDLHARILHPAQGRASSEEPIWRRASKISFNNIDCLVPAPHDAALIALAHGGLDAHANSDWLIDLSNALADLDLDGAILAHEVRERKLDVVAAIALSWLVEVCGVVLPSELEPLVEPKTKQATRVWSDFLQARPRDRETMVGSGLRWMAKSVRKKQEKRDPDVREDCGSPVVKMRVAKAKNSTLDFEKSARLDHKFTDLANKVGKEYSLQFAFKAPGIRRRCVFELTSASQHILTLTARTSNWKKDTLIIANVSLALPENMKIDELSVTSRPLRSIRFIGDDSERQLRFSAIRIAQVTG